MHEFHGWFGLAESTDEADLGGLHGALQDIDLILERFEPPRASADLRSLNGDHFLSVNGSANRQREESAALDELLNFLSVRLPGSWGLLYERSDDPPTSAGSNAFQVRVLARGTVSTRIDHFLSPCRPTIED